MSNTLKIGILVALVIGIIALYYFLFVTPERKITVAPRGGIYQSGQGYTDTLEGSIGRQVNK